MASYAAYNSLFAKGWTIDVLAPPMPDVQTITLTTTSKFTAWSPETVTNSGATLKWAVTNGITIPVVEINDPTFNFAY